MTYHDILRSQTSHDPTALVRKREIERDREIERERGRRSTSLTAKLSD